MHKLDIYQKFFLDNKVVAHRGAWKNKGIPQNSVESLREAMRLGCAGTEFDVRMTIDNVLVLCHDEHFFDMSVEAYSYHQLCRFTLPNGETIPTLERALLEGMKQTDTRLFLEIKQASCKKTTIETTKRVVDMIHQFGAYPWVFYLSFDYDAIKTIKLYSPAAHVAYLGGDAPVNKLAKDKVTGLDYNDSVYKNDESLIKNSKEAGLSLNVWTVDAAEDMDYFINNDFDYITTDEPELLLSKMKTPKL